MIIRGRHELTQSSKITRIVHGTKIEAEGRWQGGRWMTALSQGRSPTTVVMPMEVMLMEMMPTRRRKTTSSAPVWATKRAAGFLDVIRSCQPAWGVSPPTVVPGHVGPAGTGKTKVIDAVMELYRRLGIAHWLRCAAMQGGIAQAIGGVTWHWPAWHGHRGSSPGQQGHRGRGLC